MRPLLIATLVSAVALLSSVACGSTTDENEDIAPPRPPTATGAAPVQQPPTPTVPPTATVEQPVTPPDTPSATELAPAQDPTPDPTEKPASSGGGVTVTVGDGTVARYVIGEQLANRDLPNDAIGETSNVTGSIVFEADGNVVPEQSSLLVDVSTLESDSGRRDNYLRGNSLQTGAYPEARLAVNEVVDLPWPLPDSGHATFMLIGDFTVRDVTKVVKWEVEAQFGPEIKGQASTVFTFDYFELSKPRLAFILSLDDEILLELDFVASVTQ